MEDFDIGYPQCPVCGGPGHELGMAWWRCRNCGWDWTPEEPKAPLARQGELRLEQVAL